MIPLPIRARLLATFLLPPLLSPLLRAEPPPIPDIRLVPFASGFDQPTHLASDGLGNLYVLEQPGVIWRLDPTGNGRHLRFLDIRDRVRSAPADLGLLSAAFHPSFPANRRLFLYYTAGTRRDIQTRISSFHAPPGPNRPADPASEIIHLSIPQPFLNNNGGGLAFGPDKLLYIGTGDGGGANDPRDHAQRLDSLLGKILRLQIDTFPDSSSSQPPYAIPFDNPFTLRPNHRPEIYAYGFRNPARLTFDRETGHLLVADNGQWHREEISRVTPGGNFGWRIAEGSNCTPFVNPACDKTGLIPPLLDYPRADGSHIIGGYVYRGSAIPRLRGAYLYADRISGHLWALRHDGHALTSHRLLLHTRDPITSFGQDDHGELYLLLHDGRILLIQP